MAACCVSLLEEPLELVGMVFKSALMINQPLPCWVGSYLVGQRSPNSIRFEFCKASIKKTIIVRLMLSHMVMPNFGGMGAFYQCGD